MSEPGEITSLLRRLRSGDKTAWDRLAEKTYPELRRIAEIHFRNERAGHILQPTALVHEAWMKFLGLRAVELNDRVHFLALCSRLMRQVLTDQARRLAAERRTLSLAGVRREAPGDVLDLDRALQELEQVQPRAAEVVERRYFGGMTVEEIADDLGISPATVKRDWLAARAWLYGRLHGEHP